MNFEPTVFTAHIEKRGKPVKQHGFHLGTDPAVAEKIALEMLAANYDIVSIALRRGGANGELHKFYDSRDLVNNG